MFEKISKRVRLRRHWMEWNIWMNKCVTRVLTISVDVDNSNRFNCIVIDICVIRRNGAIRGLIFALLCIQIVSLFDEIAAVIFLLVQIADLNMIAVIAHYRRFTQSDHRRIVVRITEWNLTKQFRFRVQIRFAGNWCCRFVRYVSAHGVRSIWNYHLFALTMGFKGKTLCRHLPTTADTTQKRQVWPEYWKINGIAKEFRLRNGCACAWSRINETTTTTSKSGVQSLYYIKLNRNRPQHLLFRSRHWESESEFCVRCFCCHDAD